MFDRHRAHQVRSMRYAPSASLFRYSIRFGRYVILGALSLAAGALPGLRGF
jgi:hypothetical protein